MNKRNVLIFPAGSESAINIFQAIRYNVHFSAFGASGKRDHAEYVYPEDHLFVSEELYITNDAFVNCINQLIDRWNISYIIPTHDVIARKLLEEQKNLHAEVVCSPLETAQIAENKQLTYEYLKDVSYYPKAYTVEEIKEYPVFLKPFISAGGKGTIRVNDKEELTVAINERKDRLILEYLPGEECTVDCFTDKNRNLLFVGPRTRERITNGITHHSVPLRLSKDIQLIAEDLNSRFVFRGAWFFQLKKSKNGDWRFMEFSVRQAGTMTFFRHLGINFPVLSLFDFMGYEIKIISNSFDFSLDRGIETLYHVGYDYDTIYLDFDDTIIVDEKVNTTAIRLIYQAINKGKRIILITKHIGDLETLLRKYRLSQCLFDDIILLSPEEHKWEYIKERSKAIFIDNYFPDRIEVSNKCNIPVFDVDAIDCLIDCRDI